ncbi:MAG: ATP-binding protein [Bacteroidota bacterium]
MKQNVKHVLLESIGMIYQKAGESKLKPALFDELKSELNLIKDYFKVTGSQALFIAVVFNLNYKGDTVDFSDLIEYFNCSPARILAFKDDFVCLTDRKIFILEKSRHRPQIHYSNDQYTINKSVTDAIIEGNPLPDLKKSGKTLNIFDILERLSRIKEDAPGEPKIEDVVHFKFKINNILKSNKHQPLLKWLSDFKLDLPDKYLFLMCLWKKLTIHHAIDPGSITTYFFSSTADKIVYKQKLISGENMLVKNDLCKVLNDSFFNDIELDLTRTSIKKLQDMNINVKLSSSKDRNIIKGKSIAQKRMFYNAGEQSQVQNLQNMFLPAEFDALQKRLTEKNLPAGINVILHGPSGTGKTETVMQMAKHSGRQVLRMEISKTKSAWFGESEKRIKEIFTDYYDFADECDLTPILLFNEADAVISSRKEIGTSNTAQTENAMQNILLEELENFSGIFIATTNLIRNIDPAFDRRFLFKIKLDAPSMEVRKKIWKDKMPDLPVSDCQKLAENYDFSGAQIDNICRKREINEILHGKIPDFDEIVAFCQTEYLHAKKTNNIGFIKNY